MYLFTFILLLLFAFYDVFMQHRKAYIFLLFFTVCWLIFHDGFRWGVATDWTNYRNFFDVCLVQEWDFDIGYVWVSQIVRSFTDNYSVFLVLHAIAVYLLISKTVIKYSPYPLFSFLMLYCLMLTYLGMNRQYLAVAVCMFSIKYIIERQKFKFLLCLIIATLFHTSAIMFGIAYFITRQLNKRTYVILLSIAGLISLSGLINKLPLELFFLFGERIGDKANAYMNTDIAVSPVSILLGIAKRMIWIVLALVFDDQIKYKNNYYFFFNLYVVSIVLYLLFNNTILQVVVARGIIYFNIAEIFILPYLLTLFKDNLSRKAIFLILALYGLFMMEKGMNFYKEDLGYDIYRPYNSVLIDSTYNAHE